MKYKTCDQVHAKAMLDAEYRAAYEAEEALERLQKTLQG